MQLNNRHAFQGKYFSKTYIAYHVQFLSSESIHPGASKHCLGVTDGVTDGVAVERTPPPHTQQASLAEMSAMLFHVPYSLHRVEASSYSSVSSPTSSENLK